MGRATPEEHFTWVLLNITPLPSSAPTFRLQQAVKCCQKWDASLTEHDLPFIFQVDFANRESQLAFYHSMEKTGQDIRDFYEMLAERRHVSTSSLQSFRFHSHL